MRTEKRRLSRAPGPPGSPPRHAAGKTFAARRPLLHQPAEDRVVARGGEDLARHVGRKGGDPFGLHRHPF